MGTNWSTPKRTFISGIIDLKRALASGYNARLIKLYNEDCDFPIKKENKVDDFRMYRFCFGTFTTRNTILNDNSLNDFEKYLTLNYITCYGTKKAADQYYQSGKLSEENFNGTGVSHLVAVKDAYEFYKSSSLKNKDNYLQHLNRTYFDEKTADENHIFDFFVLKPEYKKYVPIKFKSKLWVVELLDSNKPKVKLPLIYKILFRILNVLMYPLKYIPKKSTLYMDDYKEITFRIGSVLNGYAVQFQIPKKFSFK